MKVLSRLLSGEVEDIVDELIRHPTKKYRKRDLDQIKEIVIHHSGTSKGSPSAFARFHVEHHGWPGIGYHYVIDKEGLIYQTNYLETVSYHVARNNSTTVGICLVGNYMVEQPPRVQLLACAVACNIVMEKVGRELMVFGHRDFNKPTCPGDNIDLETIRALVFKG